ncbi:L-Aspartase-like protein [Fusarium sp. MPI-SDFR-AT-0072]|nr:L-Aspartase-like protein [Fusarium sp. MPI-SDFR-AT-0072]
MVSALNKRLLEPHERAEQASTNTILAASSSLETISKTVSLAADTMTVTQIISTVVPSEPKPTNSLLVKGANGHKVTVTIETKRLEKDSLGQLELPGDVLYGINTFRAIENFPLSGRPIATWPDFIYAFAVIKQAAARANYEVGTITSEQANAIYEACEEIKTGVHDKHFAVDMMEGSGGTSTNMNVNEVIANIVAKNSGRALSDYTFVHPNDHVNMGQSTNDAVPSAMKLAVYRAMEGALGALQGLADAFAVKRQEYSTLLRLGRTCLQDAQPMAYGQALGAHEAVIRRHREHLSTIRDSFLVLPMGGTAIGTGFGSKTGYKAAVFKHLSSLLGVAVQPCSDAFDGMQNMDTCARLSAELRNTANSLWKIANDMILLSSGPNGGIAEITLPPVQAGSSIMPGKVNPVIPIAVCQVALAITGNDAAVSMACQQGMLEINHYELLVCDRLFDSIQLLKSVSKTFAKRCVKGLIANKETSEKHLLDASALATALVPSLGYAKVSSIVRSALAEERPFLDVVVERGLLRQDDVLGVLERSVFIE